MIIAVGYDNISFDIAVLEYFDALGAQNGLDEGSILASRHE
jgi:hypothetical protein